MLAEKYDSPYTGTDPDFEVGGVMGMAVGHSPRGSGGMLPRKKNLIRDEF